MLGGRAAHWTGVSRNDPNARAERLTRIHQQLTDAVAGLTGSEAWTRMLTVAARFHHYSPANILLINAQRPDATHVAGIRTWNALGRHVRRGETGIAILAPCLYRGRPADTQSARDTEGDQLNAKPDPDRILRGFRVVHVFDITQTDGQPLPNVAPRSLDGDQPPQLWDQLATLVTAAGYRLQRGDCGQANGRTHFGEHWVRIREDISPAQAVKTLAHELGHIRADHQTRFLDAYHSSPDCRGTAEVEAESIAHIVLASLGMDTKDYTVPYVAAWANGGIELVKTTAAQSIQTAHQILSDLDHAPVETPPSTFELTKERVSAPAPLRTVATEADSPEIPTTTRQR
jgi:antirestriction protein ArdC